MSTEAATPANRTRTTLSRMESVAVVQSITAMSDVANIAIDDIIKSVRIATNIETTPAIIRSILKALGVQHVSFRSTPKPKDAVHEAVDTLAAKVDGIDSRLNFVTNVVDSLVGKVKDLTDRILTLESTLIDRSGYKVPDAEVIPHQPVFDQNDPSFGG